MEASGQVASDVVAGLRQQPAILALVVLNLVAIGAGIWFLRGLQDAQTKRIEQMMSWIEKCITLDRREDRQGG